VHTLPLSHAPRRESGAPHRFPGHAHRAAPHPRARVVKPPVSSQAEFLRQPWAQAGSEPGVRALGVAQRPRAHASAPGGGPEAPPMQPFPNSRAWEKRFFFPGVLMYSSAVWADAILGDATDLPRLITCTLNASAPVDPLASPVDECSIDLSQHVPMHQQHPGAQIYTTAEKKLSGNGVRRLSRPGEGSRVVDRGGDACARSLCHSQGPDSRL
jgi:hypothetical protein